MHRLILALLAIMALVVAACSSPAASSTPSSPAAARDEASASAEPSDEPSEEASASADASSSDLALPSFELPNSAPELAALLPDQVGDIELPDEQTFSMNGTEFMATGGSDPTFQDFLDSVGANPDDVSVAVSGGGSADGADTVGFFAFRVAGANQDDLLREFRAATEAEASGAVEWEEKTIAGKDVVTSPQLQEDTGSDEAAYLYVREDIIFIVSASSEELVAEALAQLP